MTPMKSCSSLVTHSSMTRGESAYHHPSQRLSMRNKPTSHQQPNRKQHSNDGQPVPPRPPEREQKANTQDDTSDLARDDIETGKDQQRTDNRRTEVAGRECDCRHSTLHVGDSAFVGIEGDGLDSAAGATGGYGVAEFVEGDDQHLLD